MPQKNVGGGDGGGEPKKAVPTFAFYFTVSRFALCAFVANRLISLSARRRAPGPKKRRGGKREEERTPHPTRAPGPSRGTQTRTKEPRGPEQETPNPRGPQGQEEDPDAGTQAGDSRSPRVARLGEAFATDSKKYGLNGAIKIEQIAESANTVKTHR